MNSNIDIAKLAATVAAIIAAPLPDFGATPIKKDSEDRAHKQVNDYLRLYLTSFRDKDMEGLSYYAPQLGADEDATEEQQVAAILYAIDKFGAAGLTTLVNRSLATLARQRASGKIGRYDDVAVQHSEYARHRSTNDGIVFTEEEAFNFVPGERERSVKWYQRELGKLENELAELPRDAKDAKRELGGRILVLQEKLMARFIEESASRRAALSVVMDDDNA